MSDAEYPLVEGDRLRLPPSGHRQLHMVETTDAHANQSAPAASHVPDLLGEQCEHRAPGSGHDVRRVR